MIFRGTSTMVSNFNDCLDFLMRLKPFIENAKDFNIIVELQPKENFHSSGQLDDSLLTGTFIEKEKYEILSHIHSHEQLCSNIKELEQITISSSSDAKKAARMLESKNWVAFYAVCNKESVTMVFGKL